MVSSGLAGKLVPEKTALVVIDYQNDFVARGGALDKAGKYAPALEGVEPVLHSLVEGARRAGVPVIFVRCEYNRVGDSVHLSEAFLEQARRRFGGLYTEIPVCVSGTWGADFFGRVRPEPDDIVVTKHRFSAFEGTDLDLVLRSRGIRTLVFGGVVTHVCVESSVRDAFFKDYSSVVARDAVAGWQPQWHEVSLAVMDWGFAEVTGSEQVLDAWEAAAQMAAPASGGSQAGVSKSAP